VGGVQGVAWVIHFTLRAVERSCDAGLCVGSVGESGLGTSVFWWEGRLATENRILLIRHPIARTHACYGSSSLPQSLRVVQKEFWVAMMCLSLQVREHVAHVYSTHSSF
jgi:hypothetical protein